MKYTCFAAYFGVAFEPLAMGWQASVERHCPTADVELETIDSAPPVRGIPQTGPDNLAKVSRWREAVHEADRPLLLMDVDTYARRDLEPIWSALDGADIGYCWRPGPRPIIGGVVAVRPTAAARRFVETWQSRMATLMMRPVKARRRMMVEGGLSQTILAELAQDPPDDVDVALLDPYEFNLCDEAWEDFDPDHTRVVHLKGDLRDELLDGGTSGPHGEIVQEWREWLIQEPETTPAAGC